MKDIRIEKNLQGLIPPLTQDEFSQLEKSILAEGVRDPLIVWDGFLIDGHNRYQIATKHGLEFETTAKTFDSLDAAKVWMIDNQKGRRNLTDGWKFELAQVKRALLLERGKENIAEGQKVRRAKETGDVSLSNNDKDTSPHNTQKEIAADLGWSTGKTAQAEQVWSSGNEELKQSVMSGEKSIGGAYTELKKGPKDNYRAQGTGENEWYTPDEYLDAARNVLGGFDLDPASSDSAQEKIKAGKYYTKDDDGLSKAWHGRVWLNPPYSQPLIAHFIDRLHEAVTSSEIEAAIVLTHNYTDTRWFHKAADAADAICFTRGRIKFYSPSGEIAAPTQGQAFFYFGRDVKLFAETFSEFGFVMVSP